MITVIEHGIYVKIARCDECGCKFNYNIKDANIKYEMNGAGCEQGISYRYVLCPECMHEIKV